jgi:hypothetical protein
VRGLEQRIQVAAHGPRGVGRRILFPEIMFMNTLTPSQARRNEKFEQEMLIHYSSFEDGIMQAKPTPSSSSPIHIFKTRRRIHLLKQRTHEFHTVVRTNMLRVLPRKQFSYHLREQSESRLPLFEQ